MFLCTYCNSKFENDAKYCPTCGKEIVQSDVLQKLFKVIRLDREEFSILQNKLTEKLSLLQAVSAEWRRQNPEKHKWVSINGATIYDGVDLDDVSVSVGSYPYKRFYLDNNQKLQITKHDENKDGENITRKQMRLLRDGIEKIDDAIKSMIALYESKTDTPTPETQTNVIKIPKIHNYVDGTGFFDKYVKDNLKLIERLKAFDRISYDNDELMLLDVFYDGEIISSVSANEMKFFRMIIEKMCKQTHNENETEPKIICPKCNSKQIVPLCNDLGTKSANYNVCLQCSNKIKK